MSQFMRIFVVFVAMLFSITLADANQQALLRVQWEQLSLQNSILSSNEKIERVQALSSLIKLNNHSPTQVVQTPADVFESGNASEAEVAFAKWVMFKELGFPTDQFRLIYVKNNKDLTNHVWLAWYSDVNLKLITSSDIVENASVLARLNASVDVLAVVDPQQVMQSRAESRSSNLGGNQTLFL